MELPGKFMAKVLYGWDDQKFEEEYLNKLEKNWKRWKKERQIDESEHLKRVEEKMEEENEKIRRRDWIFFFYFLFLDQLGLGVISHAVTLVTG